MNMYPPTNAVPKHRNPLLNLKASTPDIMQKSTIMVMRSQRASYPVVATITAKRVLAPKKPAATPRRPMHTGMDKKTRTPHTHPTTTAMQMRVIRDHVALSHPNSEEKYMMVRKPVIAASRPMTYLKKAWPKKTIIAPTMTMTVPDSHTLSVKNLTIPCALKSGHPSACFITTLGRHVFTSETDTICPAPCPVIDLSQSTVFWKPVFLVDSNAH